jgi:hypothetical protein
MKTNYADIPTYNAGQAPEDKLICDLLKKELDAALGAECKLWHGHPVWFLAGNPVAGYAKHKHHVNLLFWSGQSFDEPGLSPEGTFKAAQAHYQSVSDVDVKALRRWLGKARDIQWDYKNIVKRRGVLERLNPP